MGLLFAFLGFPLVLIIILSIIFAFYIRHYSKYIGKLEGPPILPILGNGYLFFGKNSEGILQVYMSLCQKYRSPVRTWLGPTLMVLLGDPEDIQTVLNSNSTMEKHSSYKFFKTVGEGVFSAKVSKWKNNRRIINGAFTSNYINAFVPIFNKNNQYFLEKIMRKAGTGEFDIGYYFLGLTFNIICETTMGYDAKSIDDPSTPFLVAVSQVNAIDYMRIYQIWQYPEFIFKMTPGSKQGDACRKIIFQVSNQVVRERREKFKKDKLLEKQGTDRKVKDLTNFLDILLEITDEGDLSEENLRDEIVTMLIGGYETSGLTNSFCMLLLAMHPEIQAKARAEVDAILADDCNITLEKLDKMEYLGRVLMETLRRYCVAPVYLREVTKPIQLSNCILPKGTGIAISAMAMHMNPTYYPKPEKFDPDRWLPEEVEKRHKYSFVAFSGGPRGCVGRRFAIRSVKTTMATMLRHFEISTTRSMDDVVLKSELLLISSNGFPVSLKKRTACSRHK